jgi:hypothetical protein
MTRFDIDREGATYAAAARTLVATAFVAGFAALMWVHVDLDTGGAAAVAATPGAPACAGPDCLHAPAGDPSVPSASHVFRDHDGTFHDVPPIPTF